MHERDLSIRDRSKNGSNIRRLAVRVRMVHARHRSRIRRGGWAALSQLISSATNFSVAIVLARELGPRGYGAYSLAFAAWLLCMGFSRALLTQPYVVLSSPLLGDKRAWRRDTESAAGSLIALGVVVSAGIVTVVSVTGGLSQPSGRAIAALGAFLPTLLLQDLWRFAAFSCGRPALAALLDGIWAATLGSLLGTLAMFGTLSAVSGVVTWGAGALVAALAGAVLLRTSPVLAIQRNHEWLRRALSLGGWNVLCQALYSAGTQFVVFFLGWQLGVGSIGGLRSVQNLMVPVTLLAAAGDMYALPAASRRAATPGSRDLLSYAAKYSIGLAGLVAFWGFALAVLGASILGHLFGSDFREYSDLIAPVALTSVFSVAGSGATMGLIASQAGRRLASTLVPGTAAKIALVAVLAPIAGVRGAAWGLACASAVHTATLWFSFTRSERQRRGADDADHVPVPRSVSESHAARNEKKVQDVTSA